jgi:filamentous hemagglutinin family protein
MNKHPSALVIRLTRGRILKLILRPRRLLSRLLICLLGTAGIVRAADPNALPTDGHVSLGQGTISQSASRMRIDQTSNKVAINWGSFNIGANASVQFVQPSASSVALNRVGAAGGLSQIFGQLSANGHVFLLNPNGVLFGPSAQVNVGALVASSLNLSDTDFAAGQYRFAKAGAAGSVVNQGSLTAADGGYIALMAPEVRNQGVIVAKLGTVALAAGEQMTLDFSGDKLINLAVDKGALDALAENQHLIRADGGTVLLTARAADALASAVVNNSGLIEARTIAEHQGVIKLLGDMDSGTVRVAGGLDASAPNGGDGGFIETSAAHVKVAPEAEISTFAPSGKTGTWLIDPPDFTIAANGGDITGATLGNNLNNTSVTIQSSQGTVNTAGNGDIFVNDPITWSADTGLTLNAFRNIEVNANITATGFYAGLALSPNGGGFGGTYSLKNGVSITLSGTAAFLSIEGHAYAVINSIDGLQQISQNLDADYALGTNIDASPTATWNSGAGFIPIPIFYGTLDGLGHTVDMLTINTSSDPVGLLGDNVGTLRNINLTNASIQGQDPASTSFSGVGILAGINYGTIINATSSGNVSGQERVGGLVGYNQTDAPGSGVITDSSSSASVSGTNSVGGLVGRNTGSISNAHSTGAVSGSGDYVGGLVGNGSGGIDNSYSTSAVSGGGSYVGGLVGNTFGGIDNSYSTGAVSGSGDYVGGLVGNSFGGITNSYSTGAVTGSGDYVGGLVGDTFGGIDNSYSTGAVIGGGSYVGGLVGDGSGGITNSYSTSAVSGSGDYVGGLVGNSFGGITNSYSTGAVSGSGDYVGGLVGNTFGGIDNSYSTGAVIGAGSYVGGLVGNSFGGITNSYSTGAVSGSDDYVGGLVGNTFGGINNSYSTGAVSGDGSYVGGLAGDASGGITNSYSTGAVNGSGDYVGGLVGNNSYGITNSYSTGAVNGSGDYVGGLVGASSGDIFFSHSTGVVSGSGSYVGGLTGFNDAYISYSNSTGSVAGGDYVGGFVGYNAGTVTVAYSTGSVTGTGDAVGGLVGFNQGTINEAYSAGAVKGSSHFGGLVGTADTSTGEGTVGNSFWDVETSGQATSAGGTGLTTAQMMTGANFTSATSANGNSDPAWDFAETWGLIEGISYPYFQFQFDTAPQIVSGKLLGAGGFETIQAAQNGTPLAQTSTGANGFYYFALPANSIPSGNTLLSYWIEGNVPATAARLSDGGHQTGVDLTQNALTVSTSGSLIMSTAALANGKGALSTADIPYSVSGSDLTLDPGVAFQTATGTPFSLAGTVTTTNARQTWAGPLILAGNSRLVSGTGDIAFDAPVNGPSSDLTIISSGTVTQTAGITVAGLSLLGSGGNYALNNSGNSVGVLAADTGNISFVNGSGLAIGTVDGTVGITTAGTTTIVASGDITLTAPIFAGAQGNAMVLAATGNFVNQAGSSPLIATNGRWLVYSTDPTLNSFGAMMSPGNLFGRTYTSDPPSSISSSYGDRFLYAISPTLTVAADGQSRYYGDTNPALTYQVSGLVSGDTVDSALIGALSTNASIASHTGAYAITQGSLADLLGYSLVYQSANLTVAPRPVTLRVNDQARAFGVPNPTVGTATIMSGNLVFGDTVGSQVQVFSPLALTAPAGASAPLSGQGAPSFSSGSNSSTPADYAFTYQDGTLTVNSAASTVPDGGILITEPAAPPPPLDSNAVITTLSPSSPFALAYAPERFLAFEASRHQSLTNLYQKAVNVLRDNPAAADLPPCPENATEDDICMPIGPAVEATEPAPPVSTTEAAPQDRTQDALQAAAAAAAAPGIRRKLAYLVGNNHYKGDIPELETPISDVTAIAAELEGKFGYEAYIVKDATKADIVRMLKRIALDYTKDDSVFLFYAGHGYLLDETKLGYWIPTDGSASDPKTWISNSDITKLIGFIPSKQIILVSDSCYSGSLAKEQKVTNESASRADILSKRSVLVMTSGGEEPVSDEGKEGHSIFAWTFIQNLKQIHATNVGVSFFDRVKSNMLSAYPQTPQYGASTSAGHQVGGDYLFDEKISINTDR